MPESHMTGRRQNKLICQYVALSIGSFQLPVAFCRATFWFKFIKKGSIMARIYVSDDRFDSKVIKVYRVDSKYDADLLFFETDNKYDADNKDEIWYFVDNKYDATALLYWVDSKYDADVLVYKVDSKYDAEWRTNHQFVTRFS